MAYTTIDKPTDYFETNLHTGTGSTHNITSLDFAPDFVWLKSRTQGGTGYNGMHYLFDTIRGATKRVRANDNSAEATSSASLTAFNSDGYTLGTDEIVNKSGDAYVGWSWLGGGTASSNTMEVSQVVYQHQLQVDLVLYLIQVQVLMLQLVMD